MPNVSFESIGALVVTSTALIAFIKPLTDLKSVLVRLEETIKNIERMMDYNQQLNAKEHDLLFEQVRALTDRVNKLEIESYHVNGGK